MDVGFPLVHRDLGLFVGFVRTKFPSRFRPKLCCGHVHVENLERRTKAEYIIPVHKLHREIAAISTGFPFPPGEKP